MLFNTLNFIATMLFKVEPYSTFIMKDLSFDRASTFYNGMVLIVL